MQNCERHMGRGKGCNSVARDGSGECGRHHNGGGHQGCNSNGEGRHCGHGENIGEGRGGGKKRKLFQEKYSEYLKKINLPEFETQEDYLEWVKSTDEGKLHIQNLDRINEEVDQECPWGGKREKAGRRKECIRKIPYTRRISLEALEVLKNYAKEKNITETEALEKAILNLE